MWWFVTGFALGWVAGGLYQHRDREARGAYAELRTRARDAIDESARIVEASKRELQDAVRGASSGDGTTQRARRRSTTRRKPSQES